MDTASHVRRGAEVESPVAEAGQHDESADELRTGRICFAEPERGGDGPYKVLRVASALVGHYAARCRLMRAGNRSRAEEVLRDLRDSPNRHGVPMGMIQFHIDSRELDGVMDWFDKAVEQREPLAVVYTCCPYLDSLRSSPRWKALLKTMNLPEKSGRM